MNYQRKYRQNIKLLQGYVSFLLYCTTFEQRLALSCEIARLQAQNESIEKMEYAQTLQEIDSFELKLNSKL